MKRLAVLITAGLVVATLVPVQLHAGWIKTYGREFRRDWGRCAQQTPDGGYIVTGLTASFSAASADDVWLLKTDSKGDTLWTRTYGGEKMDRAYCLQQTSDGGYIIVGSTQSFARLGDQDLWLLKTDSEGDTLWTRIYGVDGGEFDNDKGNFVQETTDGGYVVFGDQNEPYGVTSNFWLFKTDASGNALWTRTYDLTKSKGWDWGFCVQQTADGGYILTGTSAHPETRSQAAALLKTDANGDTLWTHLYWGVKEKGGEVIPAFGTCVQQTPDGGYIVGGVRFIPTGPGWSGGNMVLFKTDADGDTLWTRNYHWKSLNEINCLDQTTDGGYILVGVTGGNAPDTPSYLWLLKTDSEGDTLWTRSFGKGEKNENEGNCVQQTSDGGYIITGCTDGWWGVGDLCLIKTDSLGDTTEVPAVSENLPLGTETDWHIVSSIGQNIVLEYYDLPQGFHASVFDASGRKVDEIHADESSGIITWPVTPVTPVTHQSPGVYFIRVESDKSDSARKVILIK